MTTPEKVAYLKGLAEGLGLGKETKEDKLFNAIIDILSSVAADLEDLEETTLDLGEEIDAISDDLSLIESIVYDDEECEGGYEDSCCDGHDQDEYAESCCGGHVHAREGRCCGSRGQDNDGGCCADAVFYEVTCPACENTITVDGDVLALEKIQCPNCGEMLEFDMDSIEYEEDPDAPAPESGHDHGCGCH